MTKRRIFIDMDDVLCDYHTTHRCALERAPDIVYPQSQKGFYESLKPIEGAIETMRWLQENDNFEAYILTAPSIYNPWCYTEKRLWVEAHLGFDWCNHLIICPDKSLLSGDILVDDRVKGHGQDRFSGEFIQFHSPKFPDWPSIKAHLAGTQDCCQAKRT